MGKGNLICSVEERNVTLSDIDQIMESQKNTKTINSREGEEKALEVALRGSKVYLKSQGLISDEEE